MKNRKHTFAANARAHFNQQTLLKMFIKTSKFQAISEKMHSKKINGNREVFRVQNMNAACANAIIQITKRF